jgi:hypothetical protein
MLMAEGHGLRLAYARIGNVGRTLDFHRHPSERGNDENRAKDRGPGQGVRTAMKNLRHAYVRASENTNETQQISNIMERDGCGAKENTHCFFRVRDENWRL